MSKFLFTIIAIFFLGNLGCVGDAPPSNFAPDAAVEPTTVAANGRVLEYLSTTNSVASAQISATYLEGTTTDMETATADALGNYTLRFPENTTAQTSVTATGYLPATDNLEVTDTDITTNLFMMTPGQLQNQYLQAGGQNQTVNTGTIFINLVDTGGNPLLGIATGDISVKNGTTPVSADVYFFNAAGNLSASENTSAADGGLARAGLLNIPPGSLTVEIAYTNATGPDVIELPIVVSAVSTHFLQTNAPPIVMQNLSFTNDIAPTIQTDCTTAGCHSGFGDPPDYAVITAFIDNADASLTTLLQNASNDIGNHPGGAPWPVASAKYQQVVTWIDNGYPQ